MSRKRNRQQNAIYEDTWIERVRLQLRVDVEMILQQIEGAGCIECTPPLVWLRLDMACCDVSWP